MKATKKLSCTALILSIVTAGHTQESAIERLGMYVVVSDVERADTFYRQLFAKSPLMKNENIIGFDVAGGLYLLYSQKANGTPLTKGNNAIPYIKVRNIEEEFERVKSMKARLVDTRIVEEGPIKLFKFADPDGNIIEFFSVTPAP